MKKGIYGFGNPLIDIVVMAEDDEIECLGLNKGNMHLIDKEKRDEILDFLKDREKKLFVAGSCQNTIMGAFKLGADALFSGVIGDDDLSNYYENILKEIRLGSHMIRMPGPTGSSNIFVSPDAQRTMATFLGNCRRFNTSCLDEEKIRSSEFLYFTGYMWDTDDQKEASSKACTIARSAGTKVVFNLADSNLVLRNKHELLDFVKTKVDIMISNEDEAKALTDMDYVGSARELSGFCSHVIITRSEKGSFIKDEEKEHEIPALKVKAVDSTGAGDMYAAGLLYGMCKGHNMVKAGRIASAFGGLIVQQVGTEISPDMIAKVKEFSKTL